ncbi:TetR/AcrR family transcriptional regulator [Aeromicrobium fastidiosum]|uniref:TetR/AcrR family transcriptional regulator n=1 Tax=Aeromicrobium fastidiosum TaxID=52699 RepID=UPI0020232065|nr:TetR/AcrR family transcriptional regulator [Aeromicrobium fastidiosum]MCL8251610.1 TetR/AcrR family transcriptional regulator [Aeromicrobium fastidiosum]
MTTRAPRSDGTANRARIVVAARAALSDSNGAIDDLKLHLVAKSAGVGQGTLYRHFPTREHLLAEVYRHELGELVDLVPTLLAEHAPLDALVRWLDRLVEYAEVKRGVMAAIEAFAWHELYSDQHGRLSEALAALLREGQRVGDVRPDIDEADVIMLLGALTRIPADEWDARARTVVAVVVDGLRERPPATA